jgi:hypothetical protein
MKPLQDRQTTAIHLVTVPGAADILGVTPDDVRSRLGGGKLRREQQGEDGVVSILGGEPRLV